MKIGKALHSKNEITLKFFLFISILMGYLLVCRQTPSSYRLLHIIQFRLVNIIFCCGNWYFIKKDKSNDKKTIFLWKTTKRSRKYMPTKCCILYSDLVPLTHGENRLSRESGYITVNRIPIEQLKKGDKKLSVERTKWSLYEKIACKQANLVKLK